MDYEITHDPSYAQVTVELGSGERVLAEPGAMTSHSGNVSMDTTTNSDGLLGSAKSMLGGESLFANEFSVRSGPGWVTLAPRTPGDVLAYELDDETLYAVDGAWLASAPSVSIDSEFGGLKSVFAGAGVTPLALQGSGTAFLEGFGGLESVSLDAGETYHVDNDNVVAWTGSVGFDATSPGDLKSSLVGGEGLVFEFSGPGTVWYQTRGLDAFATEIAAKLPSGNGAGGDDGIGVEDFL